MTKATVFEHNFGFKDSSYLCYMGFPNLPHPLAALQRRDLRMKRKSPEPQSKKKKEESWEGSPRRGEPTKLGSTEQQLGDNGWGGASQYLLL